MSGMCDRDTIEALYEADVKQARANLSEALAEARRLRDMRLQTLEEQCENDNNKKENSP